LETRTGDSGLRVSAARCFYKAGDYEPAVRDWEYSHTTQEREYYLAKAEVMGFPNGLEWLEKAKDYARIITEWKQVQSVADPKWLRFVGPALERVQRNWEAFQVYLQLGDTDKSYECFSKTSPNVAHSELWRGFVDLIYALTARDLWLSALDVLNEDFPRLRGFENEKKLLKFAMVRQLAYSRIKPDDIPVERRDDLAGFVDSQVLSERDWQEYLAVEEVGAALERIGKLVSILQFYEQFTSSRNRNRELRQFARKRWLVTKQKQVDYFKEQDLRPNQPTSERLDKSTIELANRRHDWNISERDPSDSLLQLNARDIEVPPGTKVEQRGDTESFEINSIEVIAHKKTKRVRITDKDNFVTVTVDLSKCEIDGKEAKLGEREKGQLPFEVPECGYTGKLYYDAPNPRLALLIHGILGEISISL
jgi:tetratricopeptide (TPR) repeat protein